MSSVATVADNAAAAAPDAPVQVFGIRHHGPGSARSLLRALDSYRPDVVLIEGPADADPLLRWVTDQGMVPPVALLGYAPDRPEIAAFWPFAAFSPEWQAMTWARGRGVEVAFCDLPAAAVLAPEPRTLFDRSDDAGPEDAPDGSPDDADEAGEADGAGEADEAGAGAPGPEGLPHGPAHPLTRDQRRRHDPLAALAEAAGYDDAERWWDDVVEGRLDGSSPFAMIAAAMHEVRVATPPPPGRAGDRERRREAFMRQTIRSARRRGATRVAVVCGAWHAPVLGWPLPPAAADARILRGQPRRKVALTWVPWSHQRLASAAGYGAGVASPGWYHHLWSAPDRPVTRWLVKVARALREGDLTASSADVIDAVRLADTLAALRNRPLAGLAEVTEATEAVLCAGDARAMSFVTTRLVVGQALGSVSERVPTVPLEADLNATCRRLRLRREPTVRTHDLDLRRAIDQSRSRLFHRLRLLDLEWAEPAASTTESQGTFRETWRTCWQPEEAVRLVRAGVWGTTVENAAAAKVDAVARDHGLVELTRTVERCLLADLPEALGRLLRTLADRAAQDTDVLHLMEALPALARTQRYGDVRGTDTAALHAVTEVLVVRICAGLARVVGGLDDDGARAMRLRIESVDTSVGLLASRRLRALWLSSLRDVVERPDLHGLLRGRLVRLLLDTGQLEDAPQRMQRALSTAAPASDKAAWIEGFLSGGAVLLLHDDTLRGLLDAWVATLPDPDFVAVLPLLRRTFTTYSDAERRALAGKVAAAAAPVPPELPEELDLDLAAPALATVDLLLGLTGAPEGGEGG